jgi:structural maintenance of chromosome 1
LELQLFKLFYNERDIDELADEVNRKNTLLEKETRRRDKIDDEIKEKKKEYIHLDIQH